MVARTVDEVRPLVAEKSIELRCEAGERLRVLGDAQRLAQVVSPLLANAHGEHSDAGLMIGRERPGRCHRAAQPERAARRIWARE
ncbi:MAG: hypothetical protein Q8S73_31880 [Deltaproteobacteria bacterium]|nr:hypothetical protein [Myxococcales bacterium]MDP3218748.1 hypothetical protein [Deltaproteobacteria bacterium]